MVLESLGKDWFLGKNFGFGLGGKNQNFQRRGQPQPLEESRRNTKSFDYPEQQRNKTLRTRTFGRRKSKSLTKRF